MLNESFLIKFDDDVDSRHCLAELCSLVRVVSTGISPDTRPYLIKGQSRFLQNIDMQSVSIDAIFDFRPTIELLSTKYRATHRMKQP